MADLTVDIITAEAGLVEGAAATSLVAPSIAGEFEVLPGHTTLLTELDSGRHGLCSLGRDDRAIPSDC